jgi:hypothetical protein
MTRHITVQQGNNHHKKQNKQTIYTANDVKQHLKTAIANP